MSHRDEPTRVNKCVMACFLVCCVVFFSVTSPAWAKDNDTNLVTGFFHFYGKVISPIDGDRCPMYPSCSHYTKTSIEKHGFAMGWIMGMDRIVRCGGDEKKNARPHFVKNKKLIYDPVENNDFWWKDK